MRRLIVLAVLLVSVVPANSGPADWLGGTTAKRILDRSQAEPAKPPSRVQGVPDRLPNETAEQRFRRFCQPVATIPECPNER